MTGPCLLHGPETTAKSQRFPARGWMALPGSCPGLARLRASLQRCLITVLATPDSFMEPV